MANVSTLAEFIPPSNDLLNKVPQVTLVFWLIKMMSTTVGETLADSLNFNLHFGLFGVTALMGVLLLISLVVQLRTTGYRPVRYWMAVVLISIFGTLVTDNLTDHLGVPLAVSTIGFSLLLMITFIAWYRSQKTLSIQSIITLKQELFYWLAILWTFALGTALGDWLAEGLGLGYVNAALLFSGSLVVVLVLRYVVRLNSVLCFWLAYVLTRPLGASYGDLLSQPISNGGLGFGVNGVSVVFVILIIGMVGFFTHSNRLSDPLS